MVRHACFILPKIHIDNFNKIKKKRLSQFLLPNPSPPATPRTPAVLGQEADSGSHTWFLFLFFCFFPCYDEAHQNSHLFLPK